MKTLAVLLPLLLAAPAFGLGSKPEPAADAQAGKTSLQLIAEALERGEIDEDTATLYRVYSVVDSSKLPPEYVGTRPMKDGTPVLRAARARYDSLRPETQQALRPYLFPRGNP